MTDRAQACVEEFARRLLDKLYFARLLLDNHQRNNDVYVWDACSQSVLKHPCLIEVLFNSRCVADILVQLLKYLTPFERNGTIEVVPGIDQPCTCILFLLQRAAHAKEKYAQHVFKHLKRYDCMPCLLAHLDVEDQLREGRCHEEQLSEEQQRLYDSSAKKHNLSQLAEKQIHAARLIENFLRKTSDERKKPAEARRKELSENCALWECLQKCSHRVPAARRVLTALDALDANTPDDTVGMDGDPPLATGANGAGGEVSQKRTAEAVSSAPDQRRRTKAKKAKHGGAQQNTQLRSGTRVDASSRYPDHGCKIDLTIRSDGAVCLATNIRPRRYIATVEAVRKGNVVWLRYTDGVLEPLKRSTVDEWPTYPAWKAYSSVKYAGGNWYARDADAKNVSGIAREVLELDVESWLLTCAEAHPDVWLPLEPESFVKLLWRDETWTGILYGGGLCRPLPEAYVTQCFSDAVISSCKASPGTTVFCTQVGAAATECEVGRSSATVGVLPSERFLSGGKDHCVANAVAMGLHVTGDAAAADIVHAMAPESIACPTKAFEYVKQQCHQQMSKRGYDVAKLKNAQALTSGNVLSALGPGKVNVYRVEDSDGSTAHAFATAASPGGRQYVCDQNIGQRPLTKRNIDAACIGDAKFKGVVAGFSVEKRRRGV